MAKTFPRHGPLGISEESHVEGTEEQARYAKVGSQTCLPLPRALPEFSKAMVCIFLPLMARIEIQSGVCLMVELLRKGLAELLAERNQMGNTRDLLGQAPIWFEKFVPAWKSSMAAC